MGKLWKWKWRLEAGTTVRCLPEINQEHGKKYFRVVDSIGN